MESEVGQLGGAAMPGGIVPTKPAQVRRPNGYQPAKVDEAGRIKLPVLVKDFLLAQPDKEMFVTFHEEGVAKLYYNGAWGRMLANIEAAGSDSDEFGDLFLVANHYGADVTIDSNGRISLPKELRERLGMTNTSVQLLFFGNYLAIYTDEEHKKKVMAAEARLLTPEAQKVVKAISPK